MGNPAADARERQEMTRGDRELHMLNEEAEDLAALLEEMAEETHRREGHEGRACGCWKDPCLDAAKAIESLRNGDE